MKRWIRWKGLIAFAVAVLLIGLVWLLVVDAVVRKTIETVGTRTIGARVELADADLSLFPAGLRLTGLAVTNPDAPMENAVEIGRMQMDLDPGYLIRRKVIVNSLRLEGLAFNTARQTSGEVPGLSKKRAGKEKPSFSETSKAALEKVCGAIKMPSLSQPDIEAILEKESLESLTAAADLKEKLTAEKTKWERELGRLADEKTLQDYRNRINQLKNTGSSLSAILGAAGEVRKLQADIQKDLDLLKSAQKTFTTDLKKYQQQVRQLADAPKKDLERLMNEYSLSPKGLANLSQLIFGEKLCAWMQTGAAWYAKVRPHLDRIPVNAEESFQEQTPLRGKGQNIRFAERPPMPDFLIRSLKIDAALAVGKLTGKAENLTLEQDVLGRPATFAFLGREMQRIAALNLIGTADFVNPEAPKNSVNLTVKGLGLENLALTDEKFLPLALGHATGDLNLNLKTLSDALDADLAAEFHSVQFLTGGGDDAAPMVQAIQSALAGIKRFSLNAGVTGTLKAFSVDVTSDLDDILKSAVSSLVKKEAGKFKAKLNQEISARRQGPLGEARESLGGLEGIEKELARRLDLGNDLLIRKQ
jgi:uncharacterized protein (TIGR03545 family)